MYKWVDVCLQTLPCHYSIILHQTVTCYKGKRISLRSSSCSPVKVLNLKYLENKTLFHTEMAVWVNEFIPIFRWSKIMVTRNLLAAARKPWEVLFSCLWWITDKAVGIQNDCSWNDAILMMMREVFYAELLFTSQILLLCHKHLKLPVLTKAAFSLASDALTSYPETKLLNLILKKEMEMECPEFSGLQPSAAMQIENLFLVSCPPPPKPAAQK